MIKTEDYTVIDLEMTGLHPKNDKIIEIGAVKVRAGKVTETLELLVDPGCPIPERIRELTGITDEMVKNGEKEDEAVEKLLEFIGEDILVGQNVIFDYSFVKQWAINHRHPLEMKAWDTLRLAQNLLPKEQPKKLEALCEYFHIERTRAHRALDDALETKLVFEKLVELAGEKEEELLKPKALQYKAKRQTPATAHQLERLKEFVEFHNIKEDIPYEKLTRSEASRLMDKYLAIYGRRP